MKHYHDLRRKQVTGVASAKLRQLMLYMIDQSGKDSGQKIETARFRSLRDLLQRRSHLRDALKKILNGFYASHGNLGYNDCTVVILNRMESREWPTNGSI